MKDKTMHRRLYAHSLHLSGKTWREVGRALHVGRDRAQQLASDGERYAEMFNGIHIPEEI